MLKKDLKGTLSVGFVPLMKALLGKILKSRQCERGNADVLEEAGRLFDLILNDAIIFCNASVPKDEGSEAKGRRRSKGKDKTEPNETRSREMKQLLKI